MPSLAFIGLGVMGEPMAGHLLRSGHTLTVHTRTRRKAAALLEAGAHWADTPAQAAQSADVVLLCLRNTEDVQAVITGPDGILSAARSSPLPPLLIIDHSTICPTVTKDLAQQLTSQNIAFIDAPVSGGDIGARNGTLSVMAGAHDADLPRAQDIFRAYAKTVVHCGPPGSGQLTKLANQILVTVTNLAVCEALNFAQRHGLDLAKTIEATSAGAAGSWQLANLGPRMANQDFRPGFTIDLQQKDLHLVLQAAENAKLSMPATSLVHQLFLAAQAAGHGKEGTQALFKVVQRLSELH